MPYTVRFYILRLLAVLIAIGCASGQSRVLAQGTQRPFDQPALESMLAPIALYPDQLLSHVLMAATYPDEVEAAARWTRERPGLSADAAVRAAEGWDWDPSVRSLTAFPRVLDTMTQYMRWTQDLGEAFIHQPQEVMDAVQRLRFRAFEAGTLVSTEHTRVIHTGSSLIIESIRPQVVHIPHYDSRIVYGAWWWPVRPPVVWNRWHGYYDPPGRPLIVHWGPSVWITPGFFFGGFDWPRREVRVVNIHSYYYVPRTVVVTRPVEIHRHAQVHREPPITHPHVWHHDGSRRGASGHRTQQGERHLQPPQERMHQPRHDATRQLPVHALPAAPHPAQPQRAADHGRHEERTQRSRHSADDRPATSGAQHSQRQASPPISSANAPLQRAPARTQSAGPGNSGASPREEARTDRPVLNEDGPRVRRNSRPERD
jgi:hypothetical protein